MLSLTSSRARRSRILLPLGNLVPWRLRIHILTGLQSAEEKVIKWWFMTSHASEMVDYSAEVTNRLPIPLIQKRTLTRNQILATRFRPFGDLVGRFRWKMSRLQPIAVQLVAILLAALGRSLRTHTGQAHDNGDDYSRSQKFHIHFGCGSHWLAFIQSTIHLLRTRAFINRTARSLTENNYRIWLIWFSSFEFLAQVVISLNKLLRHVFFQAREALCKSPEW